MGLAGTAGMIGLAGCSGDDGGDGDDGGGSDGSDGGDGGNGGDGDDGGSQDPASIRIQAAGPGTSFYATSAPLGDILRENSSNPPIEPTVITSGGSLANMRALTNGETEIATANASVVIDAFNGTGEFDSEQNVRMLMRSEVSPRFHVVRADSDIQNIEDLDGRTVSAGPSGSGNIGLHQDIMEMFDIDINRVRLEHSEGGNALRDGDIDSWFIFMSSAVINAFQTADLRVVEFTDDQAEMIFNEVQGLAVEELPADGQLSLDEDKTVVADNNFWATLADTMDNQVAYEVTRTACENPSSIQENATNARNFGPEFAYAPDIGVPYHEGASRYYEEKGLTE